MPEQPLPVRHDSDGYFLVPEMLSAGRCEELADRLCSYACAGRDLPAGLSMQREPEMERSGDRRTDGTDIRKISGLYQDPLFRDLIHCGEIVGRMRALVGAGVRLFRGDALMKPAAVGSEKGPHQDSPYWPIAPMSLWSCWIPLDDATTENGCMAVIPGSHRTGRRPHEQTRDDYVIPPGRYDDSALTAVPMARGDALFFHSLLIHATAPNTSGLPRRAVTMSYLGTKHRYNGPPPEPSYPVIH